jgi:ABC-type branched-subunit amino acid transport system substrate-binding protein
MRSGPIPRWLLLLALPVLFGACAEGPVRKTYSEEESVVSPKPGVDAVKNAQMLYSQGEFAQALTALGQADESQVPPREKASYWNLKGLIRLAEKNHSAAMVDFKKAIALNPYKEHAGYYQLNLATALEDAGDLEEAKKISNRIELDGMAGPDRKKVLDLRARLADKPTPPASSASAVIGSVDPEPKIPESSPLPGTWTGPVNEKRIGLLLPLSGKYEAFGKKVQRSVELAFQSTTLARARNYELVAADAGETPDSHLAALKKLVEEEKVIAIIGPVLSNALDALRAKTEYYQTPLVSVAQVQGPSSPRIFSCSVSSHDQVSRVVANAIDQRGYRRFAILAPDNKTGKTLANLFWDEVLTRGGEIRGFELYDPDLTDFREPVDKIIGLHYTETRTQELQDLAEKRKELNIQKKTMKTLQFFNLPPVVDFDAVFIADEARTSGQIIPTFAYRDAKGIPFMGISSWNSPQLLKRAGELAEGAFFPVALSTLNPPEATRHFYDLYWKSYQTYPGELDAIAFDAAAMVIKAIENAPSSREGFTRNLANLTEVEGATGILGMREHQCSRNLSLYEVRKGVFQISEPVSN